MIQKISIRGIASFDQKGIEIDGLKKINLIYGTNGTGKSTISRVLTNSSMYNQCNVEWTEDSPMEVLTYNNDFYQKNYSEQIPGVFTLGEASNEILENIARIQSSINDITNDIKEYDNVISKKELEMASAVNKFRESAWKDVLKSYESYFSRYYLGASSKDNFISKLLSAHDNKYELSITLDELKRRYSLIFVSKHVRMEFLKNIDSDYLHNIESNDIWKKIVIGKQDVDIAGLILRLGNTDWVSQGVSFIEEGSDVCPFCQQHTITTNFKEKIDTFFDESFKTNIGIIDELTSNYKSTTSNIIQSLETMLHVEKLRDKTFLNISYFESIISELNATITGNIEFMNSKKKEPSRIIPMKSSSEIMDKIHNVIREANAKIEENNRLVDNFEREKEKLTNDIWNFFANIYSEAISLHKNKVRNIRNAINNLNNKKNIANGKVIDLNNELMLLEKSFTSVTPAINEINRLLERYGFTNFKIKEVSENKNHYQIVRENGEIATSTLSEGERTFITFLYYMQLVKGSSMPEGVSNNRVLVIDDPVSSLDSNVLFIVSTLLREVFTDIHDNKGYVKQAIVLTHNVYFYKEITFIDRFCKWRDCINHWILRKKDNISSIHSYGKNNPIKSSYELMWTELKSDNLNSCIITQNIMRRIIENYFQIFGGISPNVILEKFYKAEDKKICRSLLSWVNDGSHSIPDDLYVEMSDDQLDRYKDIFRQIFKQMGQEAHYNMMMHLDSFS